MMNLILGLLLMIVGGSAFRAANRLMGAAVLDTLALGTLATFLLILGAMMLGQVAFWPVVFFTLLLSGALWWLTPRLPQLQAPSELSYRPPSAAEMAGLSVAISLLAVGAMRLWGQIWAWQKNWDYDMVEFHLPNLKLMLQAQSWWITDGKFLYYPQNYELFWGWGVLIRGSYAVLNVFHLWTFLMLLAYALLIARWALEGHPWSLAGELGAAVGVLHLAVLLNMAGQVGKNDALVGAMVLASLYYSLRYWDERAQKGYLLLVGVCLGVLIGTKFQGWYWVGILGLLYLWRENWRDYGGVALRIALPCLLIGGVWYLRLLGYSLTDFDREFIAQGQATMLLNLLDAPLIWKNFLAWSLFLGLMLLTGILALVGGDDSALSRWRRVASMGVMLVIWGRFAFTDWVEHALVGLLAASAVGLLLVLLGRQFSARIRFLAALALLNWLLFALTPFSAWTNGGTEYENPPFLILLYRYNIAAIVLSWIVLWLGWVSLAKESRLAFPRLAPAYWAYGGLGIWLVLVVIQAALYTPPNDLAPYNNWYNRFERPTEVYRWSSKNLKQTSVYVVGLPPILFAGSELENRVFYQYPDQTRDDWTVIEAEQLRYLVVGVFPEVAFSPEQMALIQAARDRGAEVVFEDEQAIIFHLSD